MLDIDLNKKILYPQFMDFINYQELKKEAYLMAIKKLEEEYFNDIQILKKLQEFKIKYVNNS